MLLIKDFNINRESIFNMGIERETLRVNEKGVISKKDHKLSFGNKITNPYITTDFAESQLEFVTPPLKSSKDIYEFMNVLYDICANEYKDEYLFPLSMPCVFDSNVKIAQYDSSKVGLKNKNYREGLLKKYGLFKQLICGIHYNFSFQDDFLNKLYLNFNSEMSFKEFKNKLYLDLAKKYSYYRWFIVYVMGATPIFNLDSQKTKEYTNGISFRNSSFGYNNKHKVFLNYNSITEYAKSINENIQSGIISEYKELYSSVRIKSKENDGNLESLINDGIEYLEFRNIDINPYCKTGIEKDQIDFLNIFML
ncbi:MAG: bifunctional glutamate--cysteine ligase GshA/glutathione synthetase GshB, partial [Clostridiales bacterium]|nr:bifunctional glutamate--cysteine ligase GshA/glutathione synthetase GshB [Clostridiales bacterium]